MKRAIIAMLAMASLQGSAKADSLSDIMFSDPKAAADNYTKGTVLSKSCIPPSMARVYSDMAMTCAAAFHFTAVSSFYSQNFEAGEALLKTERALIITVTDLTFMSNGVDYVLTYEKYLKAERESSRPDKWKLVDECKKSLGKEFDKYRNFVNSNCSVEPK